MTLTRTLSKAPCVPAVLALAVAAAALPAKADTAYFRAPAGAVPGLEARTRASAQKVGFALTDAQKQAIFGATGGQVDFRDIVAVPTDDSRAARRLSRLPGFDSVQKDGVPPPLFTDFVPDPELKGQWWIEKDNVPAAWASVSGKGVTVADCDSGFYLKEPDLAPNMLAEHAYDLADKDDPFNVIDGNFTYHGTAVASIIASAHDGLGTNGIAYDAKYVPLQNYNYDASKDDLEKEEATARCILRALTIQGVQVIVLENQTGGGSSETFAGTRAAVRLALGMGVTIVSAAGNYSVELTAERADDTGSIIVGALAQSGGMASFSNYGARISVAAYGENLHTLYGPNGEYGDFGGTSGATPQVAATVALMLEANPKLTPAQIKTALTSTRVESDSTRNVGGALDAGAAVAAARTIRVDRAALAKAQDLKAKVLAILGDYPAAP